MKKSISLAGLMLILPLSVSGMEDSVGEKNTPTASESSQNQNDNLIDPDRVLQLLKDAQENQIPEILGSLDRSKLEEPIDDFYWRIFCLSYSHSNRELCREKVADWILTDKKTRGETIDHSLVEKLLINTKNRQNRFSEILGLLDREKLGGQEQVDDFYLDILYDCDHNKNYGNTEEFIEWISNYKITNREKITPKLVVHLLSHRLEHVSEILDLVDRDKFEEDKELLDEYCWILLGDCDQYKEEIVNWILKENGDKPIDPDHVKQLLKYAQKEQISRILGLLDREKLGGQEQFDDFCLKILEHYSSSQVIVDGISIYKISKKEKIAPELVFHLLEDKNEHFFEILGLLDREKFGGQEQLDDFYLKILCIHYDDREGIIDWILKDNGDKPIDPVWVKQLWQYVESSQIPAILNLLDREKLGGQEQFDDFCLRLSCGYEKEIIDWILKDNGGKPIDPDRVERLLEYAPKDQASVILGLLDRKKLEEPMYYFGLRILGHNSSCGEEIINLILEENSSKLISPSRIKKLLRYATSSQASVILGLLNRKKLEELKKSIDDFCLGLLGDSSCEEGIIDWILKENKNNPIDSGRVLQLLKYATSNQAPVILGLLNRDKLKQNEIDKFCSHSLRWCGRNCKEEVINWVLKENEGKEIDLNLVTLILKCTESSRVSEILSSLDLRKRKEPIDDVYLYILSNTETHQNEKEVGTWILNDMNNSDKKTAHSSLIVSLLRYAEKSQVSGILDSLDRENLKEPIDDVYLHILKATSYKEEVSTWILNNMNNSGKKTNHSSLIVSLLKYAGKSQVSEILDSLDRENLKEPIDDVYLHILNATSYKEEVSTWILNNMNSSGKKTDHSSLIVSLLRYAGKSQVSEILNLLDRENLKEHVNDLYLNILRVAKYKEEVINWILKDEKENDRRIIPNFVVCLLNYATRSQVSEILDLLDHKNLKEDIFYLNILQKNKFFGVEFEGIQKNREEIANWILDDKKNNKGRISPNLATQLLLHAQKSQVPEISKLLDREELEKSKKSIDDFCLNILETHGKRVFNPARAWGFSINFDVIERVANLILHDKKDNGGRISPNLASPLLEYARESQVPEILNLLNHDELKESIDEFYVGILKLYYDYEGARENREKIASWVLEYKKNNNEKIAPELAEELLKYLPENRKAEVQSLQG